MKNIKKIISTVLATVVIVGATLSVGGVITNAKTQTGQVSWYKGLTRYGAGSYGAAHKTIPFRTKVKVKNNSNGKTTTVTINDRGPYVKGRILDMSKTSFSKVAKTSAGVFNGTITW